MAERRNTVGKYDHRPGETSEEYKTRQENVRSQVSEMVIEIKRMDEISVSAIENAQTQGFCSAMMQIMFAEIEDDAARERILGHVKTRNETLVMNKLTEDVT